MNNTQKTRNIILFLVVIVVLVTVGVAVGVPAFGEDTSGGCENFRAHDLYGRLTNPPPNYPQNTFNTPYDSVMREFAGICGLTDDPRACQMNVQHMALTAAGINASTPAVAKGVDPLTRALLKNRENRPSSDINAVYVFQPTLNTEQNLDFSEYITGEKDSVENYSPFIRANPSHQSTNNRRGVDDKRTCFY